MAKSCCESKIIELEVLRINQASVLKIVLAINLVMFVVEFIMGLRASSMSLMADSLDMLGDAIVYGFSLYVLRKEEPFRAIAALLKGLLIVAFGMGVLTQAIFKIFVETYPSSPIMGSIGLMALAANALCLFLLTKHKNDDINMKSTWICSRNDIISNTGVLIAAGLVSIFQSKWPDIIVGLVIAGLFLKSAWPILFESLYIIRQSSKNKIENNL